jgi:hypothetical protein
MRSRRLVLLGGCALLGLLLDSRTGQKRANLGAAFGCYGPAADTVEPRAMGPNKYADGKAG